MIDTLKRATIALRDWATWANEAHVRADLAKLVGELGGHVVWEAPPLVPGRLPVEQDDPSRVVAYRGAVMSQHRAQRLAVMDNHMALRSLSRELLVAYDDGVDPRWGRLARLLGD